LLRNLRGGSRRELAEYHDTAVNAGGGRHLERENLIGRNFIYKNSESGVSEEGSQLEIFVEAKT